MMNKPIHRKKVTQAPVEILKLITVPLKYFYRIGYSVTELDKPINIELLNLFYLIIYNKIIINFASSVMYSSEYAHEFTFLNELFDLVDPITKELKVYRTYEDFKEYVSSTPNLRVNYNRLVVGTEFIANGEDRRLAYDQCIGINIASVSVTAELFKQLFDVVENGVHKVVFPELFMNIFIK